jgi:endoglucanase Acf2
VQQGLTRYLLLSLCWMASSSLLLGQITPVGNGSYTQTFPGTDAAGRNSFPSGTPLTTGPAATKPVPTNDWWSNKVKNNHSDNLFNYPYTLKTVNEGLVATYIPWGVIDNITPVIVGVTGLSASVAKVSDFSDWTVTMDWAHAGHHFQATSGIGMPFLYFEKGASDVAQVTVSSGTVTIANEMLIITDARNGADFVVYGPVGSVWTNSGGTYTSTLNGNNYWSMAFIPLTAPNVTAVANEYQKYAYVFPTNTLTTWEYDEATSVVTTDFVVETEVKEGTDSTMLMGLLPHQWANLSAVSPVPAEYSYATVRGELKTMDGNRFQVANTFYGVLPTMPNLTHYSEGFSPLAMSEKVQLLQNDGLSSWTDSYNEGQMMNRLIQTARIADQIGDTLARDKMVATVKARLEDWLTAEGNEVAFLFYYNQDWSAMIGYPAGHGQDGNLNDHHFHWGYFIHAAAFMEQFEPGWAAQYGEMINLLVRDAASANRDDTLFPFLRNFSPYGGHCWANGFASFPQGNDQESTSESMQFHSSLIHWGSVTDNDSIRDLGIYMYTTEQSAVEEYWFDMNDRVFGPNQAYSLVSRVWGNSYDNGTFWTSDIAASYGIEMYPIHGGSLYLGHDTSYVRKLWNEITVNTGILTNEVNPNLWHDVKWEYLAFIDPDRAIELYDSYPERSLKFGISDAQTYHWLHAMRVLGIVDASVTANHPLAVVFSRSGDRTYVAQNYGSTPISVTFSDGYVLPVPAGELATSRDLPLTGHLSASFDQAYPGGSVGLTMAVGGGTPTKVEFFDGETMIGQLTQAPFEVRAAGLTVGRHTFLARIYDGDDFAISNLVPVMVGEQLPYFGDPIAIPGTFSPAHYDLFEGGVGQGVAYSDVSRANEGDYRVNEYVDATVDVAEGEVVGWIAAGEWLEYTVEVQQAGTYNLSFRYACGNSSGGGPLTLMSDGVTVKSGITVAYTSDWDQWGSKTVNDIPLKAGRQVLRFSFEQGELNLGALTFSYAAPLTYDQPVADAGANILVMLPQSSGSVDASGSTDPGGNALAYTWTQVYGPSTLVFSDPSVANPSFSTLEEGVYLLQVTADNGSYTDVDEVYVISSTSSVVAPKVSLISPTNGASFLEATPITVLASASDLIGSVSVVDFYLDNVLVGSDSTAPYEWGWTPEVGTYRLTAVATDDDGAATTSAAVEVVIEPAPACIGTAGNGHYDYEFSAEDDNPTLTFIPSQSGVGAPTCILYYGTDPGNMPGYNVTPNVPHRLTASKGTRIYFYYTYSYPGLGEQNTAGQKDTYVIGTCQLTSAIETPTPLAVTYYPNPTTSHLTVTFPAGKYDLKGYNLSGQLVHAQDQLEQSVTIDMSSYLPGVYLFRVGNANQQVAFKVMKQ